MAFLQARGPEAEAGRAWGPGAHRCRSVPHEPITVLLGPIHQWQAANWPGPLTVFWRPRPPDDAEIAGRALVAAVVWVEELEDHAGRIRVGHMLDPFRDQPQAVPDHEEPRWRRCPPCCRRVGVTWFFLGS